MYVGSYMSLPDERHMVQRRWQVAWCAPWERGCEAGSMIRDHVGVTNITEKY